MVVSRFAGFSGGINARDTETQLAPNEVIRGENIVLDERGGASKRLGCTSKGTFGTGTDRILSAYTFYRGLTTPQVLIHTTAGKLYYTNDPEAPTITWTQIATGLSTTARISFETFNSKVYMTNGVDDYRSWDGTTQVTFPSAPKGRYLKLWKDTMWMSGITSLADRVYSSAAGDAETWPAINWVDLSKGDGDLQTALSTDGNYLIVFKRDKHFVIYDPVSFANRVVDFEKGCESHFSVVQFESNVYFLSRRGICQFLGDSPSRIISGKIDPYFDPAIFNLAALGNIYAYTYQNRIGWAIPEAGQAVASMQIEYYPRLADESGVGPWMIQRIPCSTFVKVRKDVNEFLYGGHSQANKFLWVYSTAGSDDGATFQGLAQTSSLDFGEPSQTKYIRRMRILARGLGIIQLKRDFSSQVYKTFQMSVPDDTDTWSLSDMWGTGFWAEPSPYQMFTFHPDAYGRYFSIVFLDAETTIGSRTLRVGSRDYPVSAGEWGVYGIELDAMVLGVRA
jgi:hypothetical protein